MSRSVTAASGGVTEWANAYGAIQLSTPRTPLDTVYLAPYPRAKGMDSARLPAILQELTRESGRTLVSLTAFNPHNEEHRQTSNELANTQLKNSLSAFVSEAEEPAQLGSSFGWTLTQDGKPKWFEAGFSVVVNCTQDEEAVIKIAKQAGQQAVYRYTCVLEQSNNALVLAQDVVDCSSLEVCETTLVEAVSPTSMAGITPYAHDHAASCVIPSLPELKSFLDQEIEKDLKAGDIDKQDLQWLRELLPTRPSQKNAKLIVFEGLDACGKSTLSR